MAAYAGVLAHEEAGSRGGRWRKLWETPARGGVDFVRKAIREGKKVYVHCALGRGRSPTMAAAYFVDQGLAVDEAIDLIRKARPIIEPSPEQLEQLRVSKPFADQYSSQDILEV